MVAAVSDGLTPVEDWRYLDRTDAALKIQLHRAGLELIV
jgi:hypothetical protein